MKKLLLSFTLFSAACINAQVWQQMTSLPAEGRFSAVSAAIVNGYVGLGQGYGILLNDFWEYDKENDSWTQKADFPGGGRVGAVAFTIGDFIIAGTGYDGVVYQNDIWRYNPAADEWTQMASIPTGRADAIGFSMPMALKGYIATGSVPDNPGGSNDLWEYDFMENTWTQKASLPAPVTFQASVFVIGDKAYVLSDAENFWEWDRITDTWTQKANLLGLQSWSRTVNFAINGKGYIGSIGSTNEDFWQYDPENDSWLQLESIPGGVRSNGTGFATTEYAYAGTGLGENGNHLNDLYRFDPSMLSVKPIAAEKFTLSPNPAQNVLNVNNAGEWTGASYSIMNLLGAEILSGTFTQTNSVIDVSGLTPGVYIFRAKNFSSKLIKQ